MKVIFTYTDLKNAPHKNKSTKFTLNHGYNEETELALCGYDWHYKMNVIGNPTEESDYKELITCKKCRKKLGLNSE